MGMRKSFKDSKLGPMTSRDPRHGTPAGYSYWGCRCNECRAAYTQNNMKSRKKSLDRLLEAGEHGLRTYKAGCRCDVCKAAGSADRRTRRRGKKYVVLTDKTTVDLSQLA